MLCGSIDDGESRPRKTNGEAPTRRGSKHLATEGDLLRMAIRATRRFVLDEQVEVGGSAGEANGGARIPEQGAGICARALAVNHLHGYSACALLVTM
jgi:hypothetical protein